MIQRNLELVREKFFEEQKAHPNKHVTKKQLYKRIKAAFKGEKKLVFTYRTMERAIDILRNPHAPEYWGVKKDGRGKYWLLQYWENSLRCQKKANAKANQEIKSLKKALEVKSKKNLKKKLQLNVAEPFLESIKYCESSEDWDLLNKWFMKMYEKKFYKELAESVKQEEQERIEILKSLREQGLM